MRKLDGHSRVVADHFPHNNRERLESRVDFHEQYIEAHARGQLIGHPAEQICYETC